MGWIIYMLGLLRSKAQHSCACCRKDGLPTSCLPFLGKRRFCIDCADKIMWGE